MPHRLLLPLLLLCPLASAADAPQKDATSFTRQSNQQWLQRLPFNDRADFDAAQRGLIERFDGRIDNADSQPVWDLQRYAFINGEAPATINPSLWRQAQLNAIAGLFQVTEGIYQVRGLDLANMTLVEGDSGLIVIDPLHSVETARAAMELYFKHRPRKPVLAVIYSNPQVSSYGGVRGVVDTAEVKAGKVQVLAPRGFYAQAISENVLAGPAMQRRAEYLYGNALPRGPRGQVDAGLGKDISSNATISLIAPTREISKAVETVRIDGIDIEFQLTSSQDAPAQMNLWLPRFKALAMGENVAHSQLSLLDLRGAPVRDARSWSRYLDQALVRYGERAEIVLGQHHWPTWSGAAVREYLADQRDLYAYIDGQTLRLINQGLTPDAIAAQLATLPPRLAKRWYSRDYYGSLSLNVRAVYQRYMGSYDGNPATLDPLPPTDTGRRYVEAMGGANQVLSLARKAFASGDYRWVAELTRQLIYAQPGNSAARQLQADAFEQLGYQSENATWRNAYLTGAQELRDGVAASPAPGNVDDMVRALAAPLFFDLLSVRLDAQKAAEQDLTINWRFTDLGEDYALTVRNGVLTHRDRTRHRRADVEVSMKKATLDRIALKQTGFVKEVTVGDISISGERIKFLRLMSGLEDPQGRFELVAP